MWSSFHTSPNRGLCLNGRGPRFYVRAFQDLDRIYVDRDLGFLPSARAEVFGPRINSFHTAPDWHFGKILVTPPGLSGGGGVTKMMSRGGNQKTKRGQGGLEPPTSRTRSENHTSRPLAHAALAQLGERQTEDLKVPGSIPGGGTCFFCKSGAKGELNPRPLPP